MKSTNFEFLRDEWAALASLGGFAEQYVSTDPSSALVKLRSFGEIFTETIYRQHGLQLPFQGGQFERLSDEMFRAAVPAVIIDKLHGVRKHGNSAAHGHPVHATTARWILKECYQLAKWLCVRYGGRRAEDLPSFTEPKEAADQHETQLRRETAELRCQREAQEAELARVLEQLEAAKVSAKAAQSSKAELEAALRQSQQVANALDFDEEATRRRLIDFSLAEAGWNVGPNGGDTDEVAQELEVEHQPTSSGLGYADYVLRDDAGRPIAVIEAKKTAKDPQLGQQQAKDYADGLEKMSKHRPIIFFTNGYDIFLWNDSEDEPPRRLHGFHSKDSLLYMTSQRKAKASPDQIAPSPEIAGRMYQIEAIKRITERFAAKQRRALCVQATGTGKTRVAVSLCDTLIRANWARRILFLSDRRELRKQADGVFKQFMPSEPRTYVNRNTYKQREHRIYLATYPAMMKVFESFDVGFFDLIIADESHRSIYNRYRHLFEYFDALQVGLTATPVKLISRNTYQMFGCEDQDPTAHFGYEDAVNHLPPYLVPFRVRSISYSFIREGIKYSQMSEEQRKQLEEQEHEPESIEHAQHEVDKQIFNKDTNRKIIANLMANGVRVKDGTQIGKTIVFARNHNHAVLLQNLFDEMYPQYGGKVCRVIDNYDPRAEELIDQFKDPANPLSIAVSVDMLDTGIDVPEVVNLVFAKPVFSYVKFWQMIGRGTRLCEDLFGDGQDKTHFQIFDHWGNFDYFDEKPDQADTPPSKSLLQKLFETRLAFAEAALNKPDLEAFGLAVELLRQDVLDLPEKTIPVREKWRQVQLARQEQTLKQFAPTTRTMLRSEIAPLMQWRPASGGRDAYAFDQLLAMLQTDLLTGGGRFNDHKDTLLNQISQLQMNLSPVKDKAATIARLKSADFWNAPTIDDLEEIRTELRGIMKYCRADKPPKLPPKVIDVAEDDALVQYKDIEPNLEGLTEAAYRQRVHRVLQSIIDQSPAVQRIRQGQSVGEQDIEGIAALVIAQDPDLDLKALSEYYPELSGHLDLAIRSVIGLDAEAVHKRFETFVRKHPRMNSMQIKFLDLLQNHIAKYGSIKLDRLYEAPFSSLNTEGIDGIFSDEEQINELLEIIQQFAPPADDAAAALTDPKDPA